MTKFQTKQPDSEHRFFSGEMRVLERTNDFLYRVSLDLLDDRVNKNGWRYENLEAHRAGFAGKPILVAYVGNKVGDGHNFRKVRDGRGKEFESFMGATAERIVGAIPDDEKEVKLVERDGNKWIVANGYLWAFYANELVQKISQQERMSVSIETLVKKNRTDANGVEVEEEYTILGVTILGDDVAPAVVGAHIRSLAESEETVKELMLRAASYLPGNSAEQKPKERVKSRMNRNQIAALQLRFPEHRVLAASDDGLHVCLMAADGSPCVYAFGSRDELTVVPERIERIAVNATFAFASGEEIAVDACELTETMSRSLTEANATIKTLTTERDAAQSELKAMQDAESKRRVQAAKDAARAAVRKFNETQPDDEKVDEAVCADVEAAADAGEFADCKDKDGAWNGDAKAAERAMAACAVKVQEINGERVRKQSQNNTTFAWDSAVKNNSVNDAGIPGLLARVNKKGVK